eukprot:m.431630 g.431630  ORF g.431630 m.431630 type:complete len:117 (+) comp17329_c0_seq1:60-410(+)
MNQRREQGRMERVNRLVSRNRAAVAPGPMGSRRTRFGHSCRQWPSEQENVWLWSVAHVVDPATRLLHPNAAPLRLGHQVVLLELPRDALWQDHVAVLELIIEVLGTVADLVRHLDL